MNDGNSPYRTLSSELRAFAQSLRPVAPRAGAAVGSGASNVGAVRDGVAAKFHGIGAVLEVL
ncbi:MAG: hypothetical protein ACRELB_11550 [Polyangiaceae bacterium]